MKKFWTAGYQQHKRLPPGAVNIARWTPEWVDRDHLLSLRPLAPSDPVWRLGKDGGDWAAAYLRQLEGLRKSGELTAAVATMPDKAVLMCWEWRVTECHRNLAAGFLAEHYADQVSYAGEFWDSHSKDHPGQGMMPFML